MRMGRVCLGLACVVAVTAFGAGTARADAFDDYGLTAPFNLPASSPFDVLNDGRLVTLVDADVYTETAVGSRAFSEVGTLTGMDLPGYGAAFIRVSPDGTRIAVGNSGGASWNNYEVGVFTVADLTGDWFEVDHYDAEWYDDGNLGITASAQGLQRVTLLDVGSSPGNPVNPVVVENIGGASAGITFDALGNLYTGNGYQFGGPSDTGWIKAFEPADWMAPLTGGDPVDFEAEQTLIADLLSAASLGFDGEGNLYVGGGDLYGGSDYNYGALVRNSVIDRALDDLGAADPLDPDEVREFDPDTVNNNNAYYANYNVVTGELYYQQGDTVYPHVVPEPASLLLLVAGMTMPMGRRVR